MWSLRIMEGQQHGSKLLLNRFGVVYLHISEKRFSSTCSTKIIPYIVPNELERDILVREGSHIDDDPVRL